jgi:pyridoxal phosphate enzyme (YggS family)
MAILTENIEKIRQELGTTCRLVAVSKTKPVEALQEAYDYGLRIFGENKVQEMTAKYEALPKDIEWHMIGHLQTNKVKYLAPFVTMIHSVDSFKLLKEINKRAKQNERRIDCLLQVHIAREETKFGLSEEELDELLSLPAVREMANVCICGLMGMATNTENTERVRQEFRGLKALFEQVQARHIGAPFEWRELSMGMSSDYPLAVAEGSTLVRIGSAVFGSRNYA